MAGKNSIGVLDQRVTFQEETLTDDGQGGRTSGGWSDITTTPQMWAQVMQSAGSEGEERELRQANTYSISVKVRNRSDLLETMAIVWRGRRYNIRSILPFNARDEFLMIEAEGGVPL
jgi:SPP1 family predicted phage head-tail adaptor